MSSQKVLVLCCIRRYISTSIANRAKNYSMRQGKFMNKIIRSEIPKRKWCLEKNKSGVQNTMFNNNHSPATSHATRRVIVLNKLFMKYITDLMATGEISSKILGLGVEISRVNLTNDFKLVKVFWCSSNTNKYQLNDISKILEDCGYKLRHELSQLKIIGIVPPIKFFKDKQLTGMIELEKIFTEADYGDDYQPQIKIKQQPQLSIFMKFPNNIREKISNLETNEISKDELEDSEIYDVDLPPMRHDVLGLDQWLLMSKVKQSLKKCRETAFNRANNLSVTQTQQPFIPPNTEPLRTEEEIEAFNAFLLNRRIQRKKKQQLEKDCLEYQLQSNEINHQNFEDDTNDIDDYNNYNDDNDDDSGW